MGTRRIVQALVVGAILGSCVVGRAEPDRAAAKALNAKGYAAYKQQRYAKALERFREAVEADESYAPAHYNLACTMGVFRKRKQVCERDAYRMDMVEHLQTAVKLDRSWLARARTDPDLQPIHDTVGYQILLGLDPTRTGDVSRILQRVTWYAPPFGVCGYYGGLVFAAGCKVTYWHYVESCEETFNRHRARIRGSYSVNGNTVLIRFERPVSGRREFKGTLEPVRNGSGYLRIPGLDPSPGQDEVPFSDDPSECSV